MRRDSASSEEVISDSCEISYEDSCDHDASLSISDSECDILSAMSDFLPLATRFHHRPLMVLPPRESLPHSEEEINTVATQMIEITQAEDTIFNAIQRILRLAPETRPQLEGFMSENIRRRLDSDGFTVSESSASVSPPEDSDIESNPPLGLVPFVFGKKETRKPSYKIH